MYCKNCKKQLDDRAKFCSGCGTKVLKEKKALGKKFIGMLTVVSFLVVCITIAIILTSKEELRNEEYLEKSNVIDSRETVPDEKEEVEQKTEEEQEEIKKDEVVKEDDSGIEVLLITKEKYENSYYNESTLYQYEYDIENRAIKCFGVENGDKVLLQEYQYDDLWRLTKETDYYFMYYFEYDIMNEDVEWCEYLYDDAGNKTVIEYYEDGSVSCMEKFSSEGIKIKATSYSDGNMISEREWDTKGNLLKSIDYDETGVLKRYDVYEYKYDGIGNIIEVIEYKNGQVSYHTNYEYEYDMMGNLIKCIRYYKNYKNDGSISEGTSETTHDYEYNAEGNMSKDICYENSEIKYKRDYYLNGNLAKDVNYSAGKIYSCLEYDTNGNMVKKIHYDSEGNVSSWDEWTFDTKGNIVKALQDVGDDYEYWAECKYDLQGNRTEVLCGSVNEEWNERVEAQYTPVIVPNEMAGKALLEFAENRDIYNLEFEQ